MEERQVRIRVDGFFDPLEGYLGFGERVIERLRGNSVPATARGAEGDKLFVTLRGFFDPLEGYIRFEKPPRELLQRLREAEKLKLALSEEATELTISH